MAVCGRIISAPTTAKIPIDLFCNVRTSAARPYVTICIQPVALARAVEDVGPYNEIFRIVR